MNITTILINYSISLFWSFYLYRIWTRLERIENRIKAIEFNLLDAAIDLSQGQSNINKRLNSFALTPITTEDAWMN